MAVGEEELLQGTATLTPPLQSRSSTKRVAEE